MKEEQLNLINSGDTQKILEYIAKYLHLRWNSSCFSSTRDIRGLCGNKVRYDLCKEAQDALVKRGLVWSLDIILFHLCEKVQIALVKRGVTEKILAYIAKHAFWYDAQLAWRKKESRMSFRFMSWLRGFFKWGTICCIKK